MAKLAPQSVIGEPEAGDAILSPSGKAIKVDLVTERGPEEIGCVKTLDDAVTLITGKYGSDAIGVRVWETPNDGPRKLYRIVDDSTSTTDSSDADDEN